MGALCKAVHDERDNRGCRPIAAPGRLIEFYLGCSDLRVTGRSIRLCS